MATDAINVDATHVCDAGAEPATASATPPAPRPPLPAAPAGPVTLKLIEKLCDLAGLPAAGWQYVRRAFLDGPSRRVQAGRGNICARYPSRKMGRVIQAESLIELAVVLNGEHTAAIAALLDQPPAVRLHYALADGRRQPYWQTPDFLIIGDGLFRLVQCKTEADLRKLSARNPDRWVQEPSGRWRFPPGEEAAKELGFAFEVISDADIRPAYTANLPFLSRYLGSETADPDPAAVAGIRHRLEERPGITLLELIDDGAAADDLYRMVATGTVYVNLEQDRLADTDLTRVFPDRTRYDLWQAAQQPGPYPAFGVGDALGAAGLSAAPDGDGLPEPVLGALSTVSVKAAATAVERWDMVKPVVLDGRSCKETAKACGVPVRTFRRWCADARKEQARGGRGILGLLSRVEHRGCRKPRFSDEHEALIARKLDHGVQGKRDAANDDGRDENAADDARNRNIRDLYGEYVQAAEAEGFTPCAYATFTRRYRQLDSLRRTRKRRGHKAAAAEAPFVWWLDRATPPHGQYPWDIVHIDHTRVDLVIRLGKLKPRLLRVWLTLAFCAYSRTVLAFEVSFDPPSNASVMMVLRECVRRHGRLPYTIVVDRGAEFESVWFELFCGKFEITKKSRPAGRPRFGSPIERFFGTANTQFFHALRGNTKLLRNPRAMTPEVDPHREAVWTLPMLTGALETYLFDVYPNEPHPALAQTPKEAYERGLQLTGETAHRRVQYDRNFLISTLPSAPRRGGTAQVQANGKGIEINGILYWHDALQALVGTRVPVKIDPFDVSVVFAWRANQKVWLRCVSQQQNIFRGRTWQEIRILSKQIKRQAGLGRKTPRITARILAPFMSGVRTIEQAETQRLKDAARDEVGARAVLPRLVTQDGVRVADQPDPSPAERPGAFTAEDWDAAPDLEDFA